jgi:hypothetical protein
MVAAAIALVVGARAGICITPDPSPMRSVNAASQPSVEAVS